MSLIRVRPPIVSLGPGTDTLGINRVAWRADVQVNSLSTIFSADWQTVRHSRRQFTTLNDFGFTAMRIVYRNLPVGPSFVARVVVIVEWYGPDDVLLGSRAVVTTAYAHGDTGPILPEGCHTLI